MRFGVPLDASSQKVPEIREAQRKKQRSLEIVHLCRLRGLFRQNRVPAFNSVLCSLSPDRSAIVVLFVARSLRDRGAVW